MSCQLTVPLVCVLTVFGLSSCGSSPLKKMDGGTGGVAGGTGGGGVDGAAGAGTGGAAGGGVDGSADGGVDGATDGSSDATAGPATASAFCAQHRQQDSAFSARCAGGAAADWQASDDSFIACDRFDTFVAAGTVRYHAELAAGCLKADSADRDCFAPPSRCFTQTLEGTLAANAPCENDYQCPPNAACWTPQEFGYNACGPSTCFAVSDRVDEPCTPLPNTTASLCLPGVVTCVQGTCAAYGAQGEPCGDDSLPACAAGLRCDAASSKCVAITAGGACGEDFDCFATEYCAGTSCRPRIAIGQPCTSATDTDDCVAFAFCDPSSQVCEAASHVGQACGSLFGLPNYLCVDGVCQSAPDASRCVAPLANGAVCATGTDCASRGCSAAGTCASCSP